ETYLQSVAISNIPNREGQFLRNLLMDRFYRHAKPDSPLYTLTIDPLEEYIRNLDITVTSDATRGQLQLRTRMRLVENNTGAVVLERKLSAITSYNILVSEFTNQVSE